MSPPAGLLARLGHASRVLLGRASVADWQRPEGWTITNGRNIAEIEYKGRAVRQAWERHPVVQACARMVADHVAAVPLEVYTDGPDGDEALPDHELQALLDNPTPLMSAGRWRGQLGLWLQLYGNAGLRSVRGAPGVRGFGLPQRLELLHFEYVRFAYWSAELGRVAAWDWVDQYTGLLHNSIAEDITHFADYSGDGSVFGYPRAAAALNDITEDWDASRYVREVLKNDGSPNLVFHMAELVGKEAAEQAERIWQEKRANRGGRGMAAFVPGTAKVEALGFSLKDLEFPGLRQVTREDICAAFGVDPRMVGIASAAKDGGLSGQQYTEARRRLIATAVAPLMFLIEEQLNHWLAPEFGEVRVRFSPAGLTELTENEVETSTKVLAEFTGGLRTWQEARAGVGLDDEPEPTDLIVSPGTLRTVKLATEMAAEKPAPPDPFGFGGGGGGGKPPADGKEPPPKEPPPKEGKAAPRPETRAGLTPEQRVKVWQRFDAVAVAQEALFTRAALAQFAVDRALVGKLLAGTQRAQRAGPLTQAEADAIIAAINELFRAGGDIQTGWAKRFGPLEVSLGMDAAADLGERLALDLTTGLDAAFRAALEGRAVRLAGHVGPTTAQQVIDVILTGRAQGLSMADVAQLIDETVFGGLEAGRAAAIARTETVGAINAAEWRAALANGAIQTKEWLTQQDGLVRDSHAECESQGPIRMREAFTNGLNYPHDPSGDAGDVINCRCTLFFSTAAPEA